MRRGQYPSRRAATLNKSQSQPTVATTITINSTVRLKRMRMRYARVPKTQTLRYLCFVLFSNTSHSSIFRKLGATSPNKRPPEGGLCPNGCLALFSEPSFRLSRGPKRSPSLHFARVRRAGVVEGLSCYLPMRFVSIGKPHVHHERESVVGAFNPISAGLWFQSYQDKSHFPKLSGRWRKI